MFSRPGFFNVIRCTKSSKFNIVPHPYRQGSKLTLTWSTFSANRTYIYFIVVFLCYFLLDMDISMVDLFKGDLDVLPFVFFWKSSCTSNARLNSFNVTHKSYKSVHFRSPRGSLVSKVFAYGAGGWGSFLSEKIFLITVSTITLVFVIYHLFLKLCFYLFSFSFIHTRNEGMICGLLWLFLKHLSSSVSSKVAFFLLLT